MNHGKDRVNQIIESEEQDDDCCQTYTISVMTGEDPEHDEECPRAGHGSDFVKYTLVRSREARGDSRMELGIEVVPVRSPEVAERIKEAGGYLFSEEETADEVAQNELAPPGIEDDGWPHSCGWFDWQVTVAVGRQSEPIYKHGIESPHVVKAARQAIAEIGSASIWNILQAMREILGGGTEKAHRVGIEKAGYKITNDKVSKR